MDTLIGTVYKKHLGTYVVHTDDGTRYTCGISSLLRKDIVGWFEDSKSTNIRRKVKEVREIRQVDPVAIGDRVRLIEAGSGKGQITGVLPRSNKLSRIEPGREKREQIIVANIDQVIPVIAARRPNPRWHLMDRYLATAEAAGIPSIICITKIDLAPDDGDLQDIISDYRGMGYRLIVTSASTGEGIDVLAKTLRKRTSVFVGLSGVGKSTLLNAIQPGLGLRVKEISKAHDKGVHTTTHLEMHPLTEGGGVVDTPGMKLFGMYHIEPQDAALYYRDLAQFVASCRFGVDCSHIHEPGCAVIDAVDAGLISHRRYESYLYLRSHLEPTY